MNTILRALLPVVLGLLAAHAPTQEVVEAKAQKDVAARAEQAWKAQDWKAAAEAYAKLVQISPDDGLAWHHLGYALHADGRLDDALKAHVKAATFPQIGAVGAYNAACVHALQDRKDQAFEWLTKSREMGFADRAQVEGDTDLASLHDDPRWAKYIASLASPKGLPAARAFAGTTPRASTRLFFWGGDASPGQIVVDYGQPVWKAEYQKAIESPEFVGRRWRLGQDFWTTFDTNLALRIGDADIPPGAYYLTVETTAEGGFVLAFNDPAVIRKQRLDAFQAEKTKGGIQVEVMHEEGQDVAEKLTFEVKSKEGDISQGKLLLRFGPHVLWIPFEVRFKS